MVSDHTNFFFVGGGGDIIFPVSDNFPRIQIIYHRADVYHLYIDSNMTIKCYDPIVVGGRFAVITQLFKLREAGYSVHGFDRGSSFGGLASQSLVQGLIQNPNISTLVKRNM